MTIQILSASHSSRNRLSFLLWRPVADVVFYAAVFILMTMTGVGSLGAGNAVAQDWPQINGPTRDGVATGETLLDEWPDSGSGEGGPVEVWSHPVGQGFSGPVVKDNRLIIFHRPATNYVVEMLAADTGKLIWNQELASEYKGGGSDQDRDPKAVPLIHGDRVYLLGTGGNLFCLSLADGKTIWQKNVLSLYCFQLGKSK